MNTKYFQPINEEIISASDFINEYENAPSNIERSIIIPPKLGKPGFGKILVAFEIAKTIFIKNENNCSIIKK